MPAPHHLRIEVPGVPVAQPRPRATVLNGHARVYGAPSKHPVNVFKAQIRQAAGEVHSGALIDGAVSVTMWFYFARPKSMQWKRRHMPHHRHTRKPDVENIAKAALDALTGVVWVDDSQVCELHVYKWYCAGGESPRCVVEIEYGAPCAVQC